MNLINGIKTGNVTLEAFRNVKAEYIEKLKAQQDIENLNYYDFEKINDLRMSIEFCDNFIKHFEQIARTK